MNQNAEQIARDKIDTQLTACGWTVQKRTELNLSASAGVAVREYITDVGPADYILFVDKKPVGLIEAKRAEEGVRLTVHEEQSSEYAQSKLKYLNNEPLPFVYESTGELTRFTDHRDPKPRSRPVFTFHKPETFREWLKQSDSLRNRVHNLPALRTQGLRECQIKAINNLDISFKENRPKALMQMATGSGKTYTAITFIYRLLKFAGAKRVLFLVDTKNLGEQAEQEFMAYVPNDDNRKFTERDIATWASRYDYPPDPTIEKEIVPRVKEARYLTKPDFLTLCRWKTPRSQPRCASNSEEFIEAVSRVALSTPNERLRIEIWTLLNGVNWPTASTLLFWLHTEEYPILDFRALWSLGYAKPPKYDFSFLVRIRRFLSNTCMQVWR